jgi:subtilase family serine protease
MAMQIHLRRSRFSILGLMILACISARVSFAQTPVKDRVLQAVDDSQVTVMKGNVHPLARAQYQQGKVDPSMPMKRITIAFRLSASQQADLDQLLAAQQDRGSPDYHRWLTPQEFGRRFGLSQGDLDKVVSWLQSQGFTIDEVPPSRNSVAFSGTAQQVQAAFRTEIRRYTVNGEAHYANAAEPSIPAAFSDVVLAVRGLDDFRPKVRPLRKTGVDLRPNFTSGQTGNHFISPGDFATIYDLNALYNQNPPIDGTGQTIAIMGQSDFQLSDIQKFRSLSTSARFPNGLPPNDPQPPCVTSPCTGLLVGSDPGMLAGDVDEASLDLEWAGAVAPNATIMFVNSTNAFTSLQYAVQHNVAPVISISYGSCEPNFQSVEVTSISQLAQQANTQGQTIIAPSGDSGAADCDSGTNSTQGLAVDFPGSLPNVTSVGGTEFNDCTPLPNCQGTPGVYWSGGIGQEMVSSALSYIPEIVWNDTSSTSGLSATGGGASTLFPKPTWQTGTGVPNDGARDVPDIAIGASPSHDSYLVCSETKGSTGTFTSSCQNNSFRDSIGNLAAFGGTSLGVPTLAGMVALINQQTNSTAGQGNINTILYPLAAHTPAAFHDIVTGNNQIPFQSTAMSACGTSSVLIGYSAHTGYDLMTGLGSVDASTLVNAWTSVARAASSSPAPTVDFQLAFSPAQLTVTHGTCGTAQVRLTQLNGFSGTPSFSCTAVAALGATSCSVTPIASASLYRPGKFQDNDWWVPAGITLVCLLGFALAILAKNRPPRSIWTKLAAGLPLVALLAVALGCKSGSSANNSGGNGSNSNPIVVYNFTVQVPATVTPGSGTVTVTGTIAGISRTAQLTLTVN